MGETTEFDIRNGSYSLRKQYYIHVYNLIHSFFNLFVEHPIKILNNPIWILRNLIPYTINNLRRTTLQSKTLGYRL